MDTAGNRVGYCRKPCGIKPGAVAEEPLTGREYNIRAFQEGADMKKLLFVYNPKAGKGQLEENVDEILEIFGEAGYETTVHATTCKGDGTVFVREYLAAASDGKISDNIPVLPDRIVCAGGDGTLQEVMRAVAESGFDIPVGIIPTGSTNDFGYSLELPEGILSAARRAANGEPFPCDILNFYNKKLVYTAAFGLFSEVSYATPQDEKNRLGHLAYILYGAKTIFKTKKIHARISFDGGTMVDDLLLGMVVNAKSVGGFRKITGPEVELDDGKTELMLVKWPKNPVQLIKLLWEVVSHKTEGDYFKILHTSEAVFEFDGNVKWSFDGEYGGKGKRAEIRVKKQGIRYIR